MSIYNMSSGDSDPNNDFLRMHIAMDADSSSTITIFNSGNAGVVKYSTNSDYAWKVERIKYISEDTRALKASENQRVGYPESISWIPGSLISPLSSSEEVKVGGLKSFTSKDDLNGAQYLKSGHLVLEEHYEEQWSPQGIIQVSNVYSEYGNMPFVDIENKDIESTGVINLYSSSLKGCIFSIDIKRNFISGEANEAGSILLSDQIDTKSSSSVRKNDTISEWNSIFEINKNCNADSIFKNGKNRDEVFAEELKSYLDDTWHNKLKRNLWGDYIDNENIELSSRDPETLKNHIFYCFYYFGASDDINILSNASFYANEGLSWYIGLGGKSLFSDNIRSMKTELSYLPVISKTKKVTKVYGLPPRTTYSYNLQNNINIADFID